MNAQAFRHLYNYHFAENRKLWDAYVRPLAPEQFTQAAAYSQGSVRDQLLHLMSVDDVWFSELQGRQPAEPLPAAPADDRASVLSLNALGFRLAFVACGPAIGALVDRIGLEPALGVLAAAFGLALAAALGVFVRAHPAA